MSHSLIAAVSDITAAPGRLVTFRRWMRDPTRLTIRVGFFSAIRYNSRMAWILAIFAVSTGPEPYRYVDRVDVIELNHYYDEYGKWVFDQWIYWRWYPNQSTFHVVAWKLAKSPAVATRRPGGWKLVFPHRTILALSYRETWTQYDPELRDRLYLPKHQRFGLAGRPPPPHPAMSNRWNR